MYLPAKETTRLYKMLSEKLGSDASEAIFRYIDTKADETTEAIIETLATKDDIDDVSKKISEAKTDTIRWMVIIWIGQIAVTLGMMLLFMKN